MKLSSAIIVMECVLWPFFAACSADSPPNSHEISVTSLTSDFKISPNTALPEGSEFFNVSVASDPNNGFLVTWQNYFLVNRIIHYRIYACRVSEAGEMSDEAAIDIGIGSWPDYVPKAIFIGDKWLIVSNQGGMLEWVGVQRLAPSGEVLDALPVNVLIAQGAASLQWPSVATNGQEILCVTGSAGSGLHGSIFDYNLNILEDRFPIYGNSEGVLKLTANGNNFFLTFIDGTDVKLAIISKEGEVLSVQTVNADDFERRYFSSIYVLNNVAYTTYLEDTVDEMAFWSRRYSMAGDPIDAGPKRLGELGEFKNLLDSYGWWMDGFLDIASTAGRLYFFLPKSSTPGMSMVSYKSDLSAVYEPISLNSQCQLQVEFGEHSEWDSYSFIKLSSIGNKVLAAWIDGRDGTPRVYANLFEITEN